MRQSTHFICGYHIFYPVFNLDFYHIGPNHNIIIGQLFIVLKYANHIFTKHDYNIINNSNLDSIHSNSF